ncbi:MAG: hypothetical protein CVU97_05705 [Firmicutes bacterium HGW-Firmicutes-21]|nr:MAG: hypothetical protein CVU97_05705 [Firmicutes bacterium HGW-Firmicutes-21]
MKKYIKYIIIIFCLIMLDQGTKLVVVNYYDGDVVFASDTDNNGDIISNYSTFSIYPIVNDSTRQELMQKSLNSSKNINLLIFVDVAKIIVFAFAFNLVLYWIFRNLSKYKIKKHAGLMSSILCLNVAAAICGGIIDRIFWGGTLDFMCITWKSTELMGEQSIATYNYFIFDFKDVYLWISGALFALFIILFVIDYFKLSKAEKKELDKHFVNRIKSVFRLKSKKGID